jgi:response regulator RpfG family c-di-GMP phosphodiesterase
MSVAFDVRSTKVPRELLFVEDEPVARRALTHLLTMHGYEVIEAPTGDSAMLRANKEAVGVVLMDIRLDGNFDGIELAREIQALHPLTSFIFVSAWAHEPVYHERVREAGLRVGGWIDKPIDQPKVHELYRLIEREQQRLHLLARLDHARQRGLDPLSYLQALTDEKLVRDDVFRDVVAELQPQLNLFEEAHSAERKQEDEAHDLAARIEAVFDQMQSLVEERADDPDLPELLRLLEDQLEALEEKEARLIQRNYRSHFELDSEAGRSLIDQIERLLGKK